MLDVTNLNYPKISLIIPCRNEAETIGLAIEKGAQLPGLKQLIVVKGNSNDETHQVSRRYLNGTKNSINTVLLIQDGKGKWDAVSFGIRDVDLTVSPGKQEIIHKIFLQ